MTKKLKVAHIVNLVTPGGVEFAYYELLGKPLPDVEHTTITLAKSIADVFVERVTQKSKGPFFAKKILGFSLPKKPEYLRAQRLKRLIEQVNPDLVVVWSKYGGIPWLPSNIPVVHYEHGTCWYDHAEDVVEKYFDKISFVICNSQATRHVLKTRWLHQRDIPIEVCLNALRPDIQMGSPRVRKLNQSLRLGIAARILPLKGVATAIATAQILKEKKIKFHLQIAGIGADLDKLKSRVVQQDLQDQVEFLGLVRDMNPFYSNIDLFLCPSVSEPFGLVCAEAQAQGCPVICSAVDGLVEAVQHNHTGFCISPTQSLEDYEKIGGGQKNIPRRVYNPHQKALVKAKAIDPKDLASAIIQLSEDPSLYNQLSQAAIEHCQKNLNYDHHFHHLISLFKTAAQQS